ncbi:hypothetical protein [Intrasporangium chromatireducens]|uniref:hypothetical protein n=1 Tax=Intrasporangium chromatireducens TaxID=1386088 RepID=UPI00054E7D28|nr:hypothetical protein [Intrasporangium chromatireducens]
MRNRQLGLLIIALAAVVMLALTLLPTHLTVVGSEISCGMPSVRVALYLGASDVSLLSRACYAESLPRVLLGAAVAVIGVLAGLAVSASRRPLMH